MAHNLHRSAIAALLAGALGLWQSSGLMAQATGPAPTRVEVRPLAEVLVPLERSAPADVRAMNTTALAAEVTAVMTAIHAEVAQAVNQGELLVELDETDYQLALEQAEASLEASRAQKAQADVRLSRARELAVDQHVSADELLARETDVMVLQAQIRLNQVAVAMAQRNLDKTRIEAPFDGVVTERTAQLGGLVTPGAPLLTLTQTDRIELHAEIPDELAGTLPGSGSMRFESRGESWPVKLTRLSPVIDVARRSRQARLDFVQGAAAPGRSGELLWQVDAGVLPASLLVRRQGQLGVFVATSGGKAVFRPLPGAQEGRPATVDLPPDTPVVVTGRERLQDGDPIAVQP